MIRRRELPFEWECFYHFEDLMFCVARAWEALLAIYLVGLLFFVLIALCIVCLRRRQRRKREAATRALVQESISPYSLRFPDVP